MNKTLNQRLKVLWREWIIPIAILLVVLGSLRSAVADWNDVPTGSMKPSILEGDRIFVNKAAYGLRVPFTMWEVVSWDTPKRGDIAVFFSPDEDIRLVKRVVAIPGDRIELRSNRLFVNGEPASFEEAAEDPDPFGPRVGTESVGEVSHPLMLTGGSTISNMEPVVLGTEEYFMMGDNRDNSRDSRWFGPVKRDRIVGQALAVVLSFNPDGFIQPRWNRFFSILP